MLTVYQVKISDAAGGEIIWVKLCLTGASSLRGASVTCHHCRGLQSWRSEDRWRYSRLQTCRGVTMHTQHRTRRWAHTRHSDPSLFRYDNTMSRRCRLCWSVWGKSLTTGWELSNHELPYCDLQMLQFNVHAKKINKRALETFMMSVLQYTVYGLTTVFGVVSYNFLCPSVTEQQLFHCVHYRQTFLSAHGVKLWRAYRFTQEHFRQMIHDTWQITADTLWFSAEIDFRISHILCLHSGKPGDEQQGTNNKPLLIFHQKRKSKVDWSWMRSTESEKYHTFLRYRQSLQSWEAQKG